MSLPILYSEEMKMELVFSRGNGRREKSIMCNPTVFSRELNFKKVVLFFKISQLSSVSRGLEVKELFVIILGFS